MFVEDLCELSCTLTYGLSVLLIFELKSRTLDQDKVYFENVCIEQYTHFVFNAVFVVN